MVSNLPEKPEIPTQPNGFLVFMVWTIMFLAGVGSIVCFVFFHPLRVYEIALIIFLYSTPLLYLFDKCWVPWIQTFLPKNKVSGARILSFLSLVVTVQAGVFTLNAVQDSSPEQTCNGVVIGSHTQTSKSSTSYHADVPTCTAPVVSFLNFQSSEDIRVTRDEYKSLVYGQTQFEIRYRSGYLGIPWKVHERVIFPPTSSAQQTAPAYLLPFAKESKDPDYMAAVAAFQGRGQPKDDVKAVENYQRAVARGNAMAQHGLAYMYIQGAGTAKSIPAAFQLMQQSAQQGYAVAQDDLGVSYGDGAHGAPQDWVQSYIWIARAAKQGYPQAIQDLDYAKAHMSPEQLRKAQAEVPQW